MGIALEGASVTLTWPTNAFLTYTLQSSTNLLPTLWSNATNSVTVSNGLNRVSAPVQPSATFYRLRH